jgi:hypothetical protein
MPVDSFRVYLRLLKFHQYLLGLWLALAEFAILKLRRITLN